jgi:nucleoid DNA-binding protein
LEISPFTINLNNQLTKLVRTMTKADIVEIISQSTGITKVETEAVVKGFLDTIIDAMKKGENIELRGFGSFKVVKRAKRIARNPKTNEEVIVPEQFMPVLKVSKDFKKEVNSSLSN